MISFIFDIQHFPYESSFLDEYPKKKSKKNLATTTPTFGRMLL